MREIILGSIRLLPYWRFVGKMVVKICERILIDSYFEALFIR